MISDDSDRLSLGEGMGREGRISNDGFDGWNVSESFIENGKWEKRISAKAGREGNGFLEFSLLSFAHY
jgi:hypothetical protein